MLRKIVIVSGLVFASCGNADEGEVFGIQLAAQGDIPALDVAVRVVPKVEASQLAQPSAQLVTNAVRACSEANEANTFAAQISLDFTTREGRLTPVAPPSGSSPIVRCLSEKMAGESVPALRPVNHQVTIQLAKAGGN